MIGLLLPLLFRSSFATLNDTYNLPAWLKTIPSGQNIIVHNNCPFNIWPGYVGTNAKTGQPIWGLANSTAPSGTSKPLASQKYQIIPVFEGAVSIRIWARTGCSTLDGKFTCEIGDCGNGENKFDGSCYKGSGTSSLILGIGGMSLAEFSFPDHSNGNVFYDLSFVDGYTLPIKINLIGKPVPPPGQDEFGCGQPLCNPMQDFSQCPPELQKINKAGDVIGCFNIHVAAADDEMKKGAVHGAYLSQIWNDPEAWSRTACDALVGDCGGQSVNETLYSGNHIKRGSLLARANDGGNRTGYACSPYSQWAAKSPEMQPYICFEENKPKPFNNFGGGKSYATLFKEICNDAYSWQFNDSESTFQCMGNTSYIVDFC